MTDDTLNGRWRADGKFFRAGDSRVWMRAVTYGPFPGGWPETYDRDFPWIAKAGFNAIRLYEMPDRRLLEAARQWGLRVFGGLKWGQHADFFRCPELLVAARKELVRTLEETRGHPALAGVYVGNEVPADLVRWMGPVRVRQAIEALIALGRETAPDLLFAYANYPSTEYLEPENADFSAFNIYLEDPADYGNYLKRLHHIAGDRPLVVSEFGLDTQRNGCERQAEVLGWATGISHDEETAGMTIFAWSDRWANNGVEVSDWDFGLLTRDDREKPALAVVSGFSIPHPKSKIQNFPFSVIICTRNGRHRIGPCLEAVGKLEGGGVEVLVVDDGSTDGTADYVAEDFPSVGLLRLAPCGLSAARNAGAAAASGEILAFTDDDCEPDREWLTRLQRVFADGRFAAAGGPNLPPCPRTWKEAVIRAAPGAPSHVMLNDEEAEHLPGCNLAVTKAAFNAIGGFDSVFHTAGDDVDFCWRLRAAGYRLGFAPGAFVWHWRRPGFRAFLRQQLGYGRAERVLIVKHPDHFSKHGGMKWSGFVYGGGPVRVMADSILYCGPMGTSGYQAITNRMLPLRGLPARFDSRLARLALRAMAHLVPRLRAWERSRTLRFAPEHPPLPHPAAANHEFAMENAAGIPREALLQQLLANDWKPGGPTDPWDAEKHGTRILLATAHHAAGTRQILVRVWGDASLLPFKPSHPFP